MLNCCSDLKKKKSVHSTADVNYMYYGDKEK